jgi:hypothetical protein
VPVLIDSINKKPALDKQRLLYLYISNFDESFLEHGRLYLLQGNSCLSSSVETVALIMAMALAGKITLFYRTIQII